MTNVAFIDLAKFLATSSGTVDFVVASAVQGYQTPTAANAVNAQVYRYRAESADLSQWEEGLGAWTSASTTLARTTVLFNSAGTTAKISFTAPPNVGMGILTSNDIQGTGQIVGTNTNDNASSGNVGEIIESEILSASAVAMTSGVAANITSISLTAGDWDVFGNFAIQGFTSTSSFGAGFTTTSGTFPTPPNKGGMIFLAGDQAGTTWAIGGRRFSFASTTTVYLVGKVTFTGSGSGYGYIGARRIR